MNIWRPEDWTSFQCHITEPTGAFPCFRQYVLMTSVNPTPRHPPLPPLLLPYLLRSTGPDWSLLKGLMSGFWNLPLNKWYLEGILSDIT